MQYTIRKYLIGLGIFLLLMVLCAVIATAGLMVSVQYFNNEIATAQADPDNEINQPLFDGR